MAASAQRSTIDIIDVRRFGAVGDDTTDSATAIQLAIDYAASTVNSAVGSFVDFPKGKYRVGSQIKVKNGVILRGFGRGPSIIKALDSFPTSTAVVRLGDGTATAFGVRLENMVVDANNLTGSGGVYSTEANEQSGLQFCTVQNFKGIGVNFDTGSSIISIENCEVYAGPQGATCGIQINAAGQNCVRNTTVSKYSGTGAVTDGILIGSSDVRVDNVHVEVCTTGVNYGNGSSGFVSGLYGNSATGTLLKLQGTTKDVVVVDLVRNGATTILNDQYTGRTYTDDFKRLYVQYEFQLGHMRFFQYTGSPEGVVTAAVGSLCSDVTNGELYIKNTGTGNTGWKLVTHA